jgi:hypothetical protein
MSNLSDFLGGVVKSVQRGFYSGGGPSDIDISISAVTLSKSILLTSFAGPEGSYGRLTSSTNVQLHNGYPGVEALHCGWQVIEFY